jgi:hypothetical protein
MLSVTTQLVTVPVTFSGVTVVPVTTSGVTTVIDKRRRRFVGLD